MKFKLLAGVALAAVFTAAGASAQETGWYGALDLGYHWADGINATSSNPAPDGKDYDWRWSYENSHEWAGFARLGYRFDPHWRVELEGGFRNGSLGEVFQDNPLGQRRPVVLQDQIDRQLGSAGVADLADVHPLRTENIKGGGGGLDALLRAGHQRQA